MHPWLSRPRATTNRAKHEVLHSLVVLASWAALESLITDLCSRMLQLEPELLATEPFKKLKLPLPPEFALLDRPAQIEFIAQMAFARGGPTYDDGKGKFERQLRTRDKII